MLLIFLCSCGTWQSRNACWQVADGESTADDELAVSYLCNVTSFFFVTCHVTKITNLSRYPWFFVSRANLFLSRANLFLSCTDLLYHVPIFFCYVPILLLSRDNLLFCHVTISFLSRDNLFCHVTTLFVTWQYFYCHVTIFFVIFKPFLSR